MGKLKFILGFIVIVIVNILYKNFEIAHMIKEEKTPNVVVKSVKLKSIEEGTESEQKELEIQSKDEVSLKTGEETSVLDEELALEDIDLEEKVTLENREYVIQKGDTISDISKEYKIKTDYIYANNMGQNLKVLKVGEKIKIPTEDGIFYTVKKGDTFEKISKNFAVNIDTIKTDNEIDKLLIGTQIFLREPKISKYMYSVNKKTGKVRTVSGFTNPLVAMSLTSGYGTRNHPVLKRVLAHGGVDLKAKTGTKIMAAKSGVVAFAGRMSGYGKIVIIKHDNGYETRYAHLSRISVKKGQKVSTKECIALSGATGRVTGPHLHFEIRKNGRVVNPLKYLKI